MDNADPFTTKFNCFVADLKGLKGYNEVLT